MRRRTRWYAATGRLMAWALAALTLTAAAGQAAETVVLGLLSRDAEKYNVEYMRFSRMNPHYKANDIQASLAEVLCLYNERFDWPEDEILAMLKKYHVVHLNTTSEGIHAVTPWYRERAQLVGRALKRYVEEGGGLYIQPRGVRYPNDQDEKYWNLVLEPLGVQILHEGVFDTTRVFRAHKLPHRMEDFFYTTNMADHPVLNGIRCLYLPLTDFGPWPGVPAMQYTADWTAIVRGEKEAKSYKSGKDGHPNHINLETPGTYESAPPIVAVRTLGKGRILSYPLAPLHTGINVGNPLWEHTVETKGDPVAGRPSDSLQLQMNAYRWLAEPAMRIAGLGTYRPEPYKPVEFPQSVDFDQYDFPKAGGETVEIPRPDAWQDTLLPPSDGVRGIHGAHTNYTDGKGTVAEYVRAAKAAGLSFIIFADPLEELTPEELTQLLADCKAQSKEGEFYACPGIEFTDGNGVRWAFWGERIVYPEPTFGKGKFTYTQWDGKRIHHYGQYSDACGFPPSAVLDYKQFRAAGSHPENQWWFWSYMPVVYDGAQKIADNHGEYLRALRNLRWLSLASFTRITAPDAVAEAAATCFMGARTLEQAQKVANTRGSPYYASLRAGNYASEGPVVAFWDAINIQMEYNWAATKGAQRVRLRFVVRSPDGIAEVKVHDADQGVFRRFAGGGAKELAREFEAVHDKQHWLTLEVVDTKGKRAFSTNVLLFAYKQGLFRCGDNLNILGPTGMIWHPDRSQMFCMAKNFRNGEDFTLEGWDRGAPLCPMPRAQSLDFIRTKEAGVYPDRYKDNVLVGNVQDVRLGSYNIQVATKHLDFLAETHDSEKRPGPAFASTPRDLGPLEYFERDHTIYSLMDRTNHYIIWNYRRRIEGSQGYRGSFIWHEGEIRFKKDVTLTGNVPIPLLFMTAPTDLGKNWGDTAILTDADGTTRVNILRDEEKPVRFQGRLRPGGYATLTPSLVGYHGFLPAKGMDFAYDGRLPGRLYIGLGENGQEVKAGEVMKYAFAMGDFAEEDAAGNDLLEHTVKALNMAGGTDGYPVAMKTGTLEDATFFFTAKAEKNEAAFTLGPVDLIVDLPVKVKGLADNGCAAVYSTARPWFRFVPVVEDTALFQEDVTRRNELWVGNLFVADNDALRITVVVDGQAAGKAPLVEVHNPTAAEVRTTLRSPAGAPLVGGTSGEIAVPAMSSLRYRVVKNALEPEA